MTTTPFASPLFSAPSRFALLATLGALLPAAPAMAQAGAPEPDTEQPTTQIEAERIEKSGEDQLGGSILVTAEGLGELDFIAAQSVLDADDIQRNLNGQIGELLAKLPGVSATSFAPGASRPILRGQDAERVRVLIDGLGTADVGNTSADHATTIEPLVTERIEVLRGPAALLFGSQAIGGVVNVIDRRIPTAVPEDGIDFDSLLAADTATGLISGGASVDIAAGENVVFHFDGSYRDTDDVEIPGFQVTREFAAELVDLAAEEAAAGEDERAEELLEAAEREDVLPNSATESYTLNGGIGVFLGESSFGFSVGYFDTDYGVIGNPAFEEEEEGEEEGEGEGEEEGEEFVTIGLQQLRVDFRADIALGDGFFDRLKVRAGYSDYEHTEFEGAEVGTVFDSETFEARAELAQSRGGVIGVQFLSRDFAAVGAEAFVPPNETTQFSIFTAQEYDFGGIQIEGAGRFETVDVESEPLGLERDFDLLSGALSVVAETGESANAPRFGVTVSRSERAPAGEELFADGPHVATQTFEIGDPDLEVESAWGLEAFARGSVGGVTFSASIYQQWFDNFIFLQGTDEIEDGLPVFNFLAEDAEFFGFEGQVTFLLVDTQSFALVSDLRASYVEASFDDGGNVPRIPPLELYAALEAQTRAIDVRAEVQFFAEQDEIDAFETPTDEFALVNTYVTWRPLPDNPNVALQLGLENLANVTGRRHSSFTKDFAPLPGRNLRVSLRSSF